jgi:hypothetical protein
MSTVEGFIAADSAILVQPNVTTGIKKPLRIGNMFSKGREGKEREDSDPLTIQST